MQWATSLCGLRLRAFASLHTSLHGCKVVHHGCVLWQARRILYSQQMVDLHQRLAQARAEMRDVYNRLDEVNACEVLKLCKLISVFFDDECHS